MSVGYRVVERIDRPPAAITKEFLDTDPADLSDVMRQSRTMLGIGPVYQPIPRIAGPAVTVCTPLGGVNMLHVAMDLCRPGDVLVVSVRGDLGYAMTGGYFARALHNRGLAGVVVDGAVRDAEEIRDAGLPVFARGIATNVCVGEAPGEVNLPIACGGTVVNPGDIVVADANGVVAVPRTEADWVLERIRELHERHESWADTIARGEILNIARTRARLAELGCEFVPDSGCLASDSDAEQPLSRHA